MSQPVGAIRPPNWVRLAISTAGRLSKTLGMVTASGSREVSFALVSGDDQVRDVLPSVLERKPGVKCVGKAPALADLAEAIRDLAPDVVLVDKRLSSVNDVYACRRLRSASPGTSLIVLVPYLLRRDQILAAMSGASACLMKEPGAWNLLRQVVLEVGRGDRAPDPSVLSYLPRPPSFVSPYRLTLQEEALFVDLLRLKIDSEIMAERRLTSEAVQRGIAVLARKLLEP